MGRPIGLFKGIIGVETYSGVIFDLKNPTPDMVRIEDIAHQLAGEPRFASATTKWVSVAEHSALVHDLLVKDRRGEETCFAGLMHDAQEYILKDLPRPLKMLLPEYKAIEERVAAVIRERFDVLWTEDVQRIVHEADNVICCSEAEQNMRSGGKSWDWGDVRSDPNCYIPGFPQGGAKMMFLERFRKYRNG